jgi:hypothetical protein
MIAGVFSSFQYSLNISVFDAKPALSIRMVQRPKQGELKKKFRKKILTRKNSHKFVSNGRL